MRPLAGVGEDGSIEAIAALEPEGRPAWAEVEIRDRALSRAARRSGARAPKSTVPARR